ncbi:hypothetical protein EVAR_25465_1 [Eumeta japonica]|uniref:Uncharacterized protein n=1 Tax=Eumeta variegata TaxID=151549 RepID=A0A4C1VMK1_EUMVA|nr:hypothetical protein EVAR_25465_1 [Eumeta japonica]
MTCAGPVKWYDYSLAASGQATDARQTMWYYEMWNFIPPEKPYFFGVRTLYSCRTYDYAGMIAHGEGRAHEQELCRRWRTPTPTVVELPALDAGRSSLRGPNGGLRALCLAAAPGDPRRWRRLAAGAGRRCVDY